MSRLSAFVLPLMAAATLAGPALATNMTNGAIEAQLIGKRIEANRLGADLIMLFDNDGLVRLTDPDGVSNGTWTLDDGTLCMTIVDGTAPGETCMTFISRGGGVYSTSSGISMTVVDR